RWAPPAGSRSSSSAAGTCSSPSRAPACSSSPRARPARATAMARIAALRPNLISIALAVLFGLLLFTPDLAHAQAAAPAAPVAAPAPAPTTAAGQPGALDRAIGTIAGDGRPLSLSLQILLLMSLLTVLPSV